MVPAGVAADAFTCELAAVRCVDVEATTSAPPPARHREVFALGGDVVWAVDLSEGPGGKMKTRVPKAGDPDVASSNDAGGGGRRGRRAQNRSIRAAAGALAGGARGSHRLRSGRGVVR